MSPPFLGTGSFWSGLVFKENKWSHLCHFCPLFPRSYSLLCLGLGVSMQSLPSKMTQR